VPVSHDAGAVKLWGGVNVWPATEERSPIA